MIDFYDKLKSISKGYASFDYHLHDFRESKLIKLDILLNGESVDALSTLTHVDNAVTFGRRMCEKLKELIPRQQFDIAIQAAIGAKIIARETIKAVRKDVTASATAATSHVSANCLRSRRKARSVLKQIGSVEVRRRHSSQCSSSTDSIRLYSNLSMIIAIAPDKYKGTLSRVRLQKPCARVCLPCVRC
ncbi:hypothetical protein [Muribaculum intestinale]|uniref:hypothetical protein n=1 Tax=Muribaculum intestinale TaxID=1796646 RepID=UPI003F662448